MKMTIPSLGKAAARFFGVDQKSIDLFSRFYREFGQKDRAKFWMLFFGAVISGLIELLGLVLLYLLLRVLIGIKTLSPEHPILAIFSKLGVSNPNFIVPIFGALILGIFIFKNIFLIGYYQLQHRTLKKWKNEISRSLMSAYLLAPYQIVLGYNSSTILRNVNGVINQALDGFILSAFNYLSNVITGLLIVSILFSRYFFITIAVTAILITSTTVQNILLKQKLRKLGMEHDELVALKNKSVNQGIHALKETKVLGKESYFIRAFAEINGRMSDVDSKTSLYLRLPAHITEIVVIISVLFICAFVLIENIDNPELSVSSLGLLAAVAFRLAPVMNRTVASLQGMNKNIASMDTLFGEFEKLKAKMVRAPSPQDGLKMVFSKEIEFRNVSYSYPKSSKESLYDVSVSIKRGEFIGIVGPSGAGKTTLVDILLGLLSPTHGQLLVDSQEITEANLKNWQVNLGYVPQSVYMSDASVRENVAFGIESALIDNERVNQVLEQVDLLTLFQEKPEGINFIVGENGKHLSGGQKQRLGIARALFTGAEVIVLDEATSALDVATEHLISNSLGRFHGTKTLIVIAHRLSTVINADRIMFLEHGKISGFASFDELLSTNENFAHLARLAKIARS